MKIRNPALKSLAVAGMLAAASVIGAAAISTPAFAQQEQRQPPPTRSSDTLSDRVYRTIAQIQEMMTPEDPNRAPNLEGAKRELDTLNQRYDTLNDFEKSTLLNFYSNYYLAVEDMNSALATFERILTIENLRQDQRLRALFTLGQLYASEERYRESIETLGQWRAMSETENENVFLILATAHYNLEQHREAIPHLISHMNMLREGGREIRKNIYGLLQVMYLEIEDFPNALDVTRTIVALFDEPADWRNLAAIYGTIDDEPNRVRTLDLAYQKGYFSMEAEYLNLAQSLAGLDAPIRGIKIMEEGIAKGHVEETAQNIRRLTQMYIMASEYQAAVTPARRLTQVANDGESWDYLGYIFLMNRDYAGAADALNTALQRGGIDNVGEVQLSLARALVELGRYDEAAAAARRAMDLNTNNARQFLTFVENTKRVRETLEQRKQESIEYYRS
jgi:tetratricopeptide (TPR) repeat protein